MPATRIIIAPRQRLTALVVVLLIVCAIAFIQVLILAYTAVRCFYSHVLCPEVDFHARYGKGSWVAITGGSSGQGRRFAIEFARRGFNLLLIGSRRSFDVQKEINGVMKATEVRVVLKDFTEAWQDGFFDEIREALDAIPKGNLAFLINNVGHRVAYAPHHEMPEELIAHTIACGTITQAMMTRICLPHLLHRDKAGLRSGMISITAQVLHPNFLFSICMSNDLFLPYLAPYEASNAFGFFHANSIYKEYSKNPDSNIDMLVITPGAVLTSNTEDLLKGTLAAVTDVEFVDNIMRLVGNVEGVWSGSWKQGLCLWLIGLVPPLKDYVLHTTGLKLAKGLMKRRQGAKRVVH
jgi:NAD(P)-dependent dehydrogenase (short-subunit alcohol dehydrogenase family)